MPQDQQSSDAVTATAPTSAIQSQPSAPAPQEPEWLPQRLERAKASAQSDLLRSLGVQSVDDAKALVEAARKLENERKTEAERFAEKLAALEPRAKQAEDYARKLGAYADAELSKLSEAQRAAVLGIVGDDKTRVLDTIEVLRPTWAVAPPVAPQQQAPAQVAAPQRPPPASTSGATVHPSGAISPQQVDHRAEYERIKATHPVAAALYLVEHSTEIYRDAPNQ